MPYVDRHISLLAGPSAAASGGGAWRFELEAFGSGPIGDLTDVKDRTVTFQLVRPGTIEFTMPTHHPRMDELLTYQHLYIKAYRNNILRMVTETTRLQVVGSGTERSIRVTATESGVVRLTKRLIGKSAAGVTYTNIDRTEMVRLGLAAVNSEAGTGVVFGGAMPSTIATAGPWRYKRLMEAIVELGKPLNGFDWWFDPVEPSTGPHARIQMAPVRGAFRPNAIFEYGTGSANAREYEWLIDVGERISDAYVLPATYPDNTGLAVATAGDNTTRANIGRREDVVQNDLVDYDLRLGLAEETVAIRKNPKNVFVIQPAYDDGTGRVPTVFEDYDVGDVITGRVNDQGALLLNGYVRVYGVRAAIDDQGAEELTLALVDEE